MAFKIERKQPGSNAVREFAERAPTRPAHQESEPPQSKTYTTGTIFRMSQEDADLLDFVFVNSTAKSKQKLLESIILPALQRQADTIRKA